MAKTLLLTIPFVLATGIAPAQANTIEQEVDDLIANGLLPAEVEIGIFELMSYGDRFEHVIRAVIAEQARPAWGGSDCGDTGFEWTGSLPSS